MFTSLVTLSLVNLPYVTDLGLFSASLYLFLLLGGSVVSSKIHTRSFFFKFSSQSYTLGSHLRLLAVAVFFIGFMPSLLICRAICDQIAEVSRLQLQS